MAALTTPAPARSRASHRAILGGLALALAACEVAGRTGALPTLAAGGPAAVLALPFFAPAMLGAFACQLLLRPVATELAATAALSAISAPALWHFVLAGEPWAPLLAACTGLGGAALAVLAATAASATEADDRDRAVDALLPAAILPLFVVLANPMVYLTAALWPTTFDHRIHLADLAFGAPLSFVAGRFVDGVPGLRELCLLVYVCLPLALMLVHAGRARVPVRSGDALVAFVAVTVVGYAGYQVVPVAGPVYAFGAAFPSSPPDASSVDAARSLVFPIPRNCMPSLHSAWALLVWWNARPLAPLARTVAGAFLAVTLLATVGLGYHYVVDVVAAFPLTMAVQAWATRAADARLRRVAMAGGLALAAAWIALVTFATAAFAWTPLLPWTLAGAVVAWSWWMEARVAATRVEDSPEAGPARADPTDAAGWQAAALAATMPAIMAVAGFAWALHWRVHTNIVAPLFATTAAARTGTTVTTLAVMAAGAAAAAMARRRSSIAPLRAMAAALGAMAAASLASATVLPSVELGAVDASLPVLPMAFLAGAAMTFAAEAAGATRPAAAAVATSLAPGLGGAAALALVAAYFVLPNARAQHLPTALLVLATLAAAAVAAWERRGPGADASGIADAASNADGLPSATPGGSPRRGSKLAVAAGGVVGAALLAALSRLLVVAVGDTVFTEARLACTLAAGLAAGLVVAARVEARARRGMLDHTDGGKAAPAAAFDARAALAWTAAALASAITLGLPLWNALPAHFATYQGYIAHDGFLTRFPEREFVRLLAGLVMAAPAAACVGAAFAFAASLARDGPNGSSSHGAPSSPAGAIPFGSALVGAGAGILAEALLAAPLLGAKATLLGGSACALAAAMVAAVPVVRANRGSAGTATVRGAIAASAVLLLASAAMVPLDHGVAASESGFTLRPSSHGVLVDALGHVGGLVTVHRAPARREGAPDGVATGGDEALHLVVNGRRRDGTDADLRVAASTAIGELPPTARRGRAVVAGLASGRGVRALVEAGFADVVVAEPDGAVVELARRHFAAVHGGALDRDGVRILGLDGRSVLAESDGGVDLVVIENSDVATLEAAAMATREMHALVAARLAPGGALLQRLAVDRLSPVGLASVLASLRAAFAEVHVRHAGDEALVVACAAGCAGLASASPASPASPATPTGDEGLLRTPDVDALVESLARHLGVSAGALAASDADMAFQHNLPTGVALSGRDADDARALLARMTDAADDVVQDDGVHDGVHDGEAADGSAR